MLGNEGKSRPKLLISCIQETVHDSRPVLQSFRLSKAAATLTKSNDEMTWRPYCCETARSVKKNISPITCTSTMRTVMGNQSLRSHPFCEVRKIMEQSENFYTAAEIREFISAAERFQSRLLTEPA